MNKESLYNAIKSINIEELNDSDKNDLLALFNVTKNPLVRHHIAFIFSDLKFNEAIPFILNKIFDKELYSNNDSLVNALCEMDLTDYFIPLIEIICQMDYSSRIQAYDTMVDLAPNCKKTILSKALAILENKKCDLESTGVYGGEESTYDFVTRTIDYLNELVKS